MRSTEQSLAKNPVFTRSITFAREVGAKRVGAATAYRHLD